MIRRSVREWDYIPIEEPGPGSFSRAVADRVVECAAAVRTASLDGERILVNHPKKLRAQQVVGVIAADGVTLEILPKIDGNESDAAARRSLVHMLAVVLDLDIVEGGLTDLGWQRDDLLEILIRLFCDRLFEALHRGLPRRYVPHEDDLAALRGRLDVKRQFTVLAASPQRLACRFDELSADIALNQIMKAAVTKLTKVARAPENQRRLAELSFAFADITAVPVKALPWHQVVIDRTNRSWAQLLSLAKLLLGDRFQTTSSGDARGFSLLFEMNKLFEEFVGRSLVRALAGTGFEVRLQGPRGYALADLQTGQNRFATKPDITVSARGTPMLVIDTKWKRLRGVIDDPKYGVGQADVYQMMAYAHVYQCERLLLLYPHHPGLGSEAAGLTCVHRINGTDDSRIAVGTLSLSNPKAAVGQLRDLLLSDDLGLQSRQSVAA
ncbi:McrBC 5-methylcytosine restriction system component [Pacificimonas flava]|uniref:McrBC 5-methylcytosine restriction system component n=1 Tax=Pacificimonas flava TaxID=1234595 RepID=M2U1E7_9SPHN|nr:McrBC 5-methylcytosine restriction system component [Pacificimonas flava]EMD81817.1 McrBC 5-methylcytosine restriction system component [Pacificimonas flava]